MSTRRCQAGRSICPEQILGPSIGALLIGVSILAVTAPMVHAQTSGQVAPAEVQGGGHYLVTFGLDQTTLTEEDRRVIAQAADGLPPDRIGTDHRDRLHRYIRFGELQSRSSRSGGPRLWRSELEAEGVPATSIVTVGRGEENLLVPTADGVSEPRNRRVEIVVQEPPAPAPVAAAPAPAPEPEPEPEPEPTSVLTLGPIYGHNFGENNDGGENDLVGGELVYNAFPGFLGGMSLKQAVLYSFNGNNDGINGRSAVSLDFAPDLGIIRPFLSGNFGGVYGGGFQDGIIFGPEVGFNLNLIEAVDMRAKVAYDFQARELGWDDGILWTGLGIGVAF